ncbi:YajQ family cyclic di-GMP-binding protein [Paucibacter aquatile]|uniref:Nucleotide-binding protein C1O66_22175 n=1 Tax=Kinneretia aquatilis TaxID=2070761 RepID=A0A2N8KSI5_9BURK|nr:YajQ family cyclic di-GMP-binding protein [Paucibacter aquatile]OYU28855.1 MAG: YajQ family cyclic di-GMP-binding protein [Burkholderiales bacterium PBB2]PND36403.1 YajQ family cyclic di-GMP-binding protein [Paucibacter aquatile]
MPSFDTTLEADMVKIRNGVDNSIKEISTRFDFKGTAAEVTLKEKEKEIHSVGESDFQLEQIEAVLYAKLVKQGVVINFLDKQDKVEKLGGDKVRQVYKIKNGIESDLAKKIVSAIKNSKIKVQASIQGDTVRVTGKNRDDLQVAINMLKKEMADVPLDYGNFRD